MSISDDVKNLNQAHANGEPNQSAPAISDYALIGDCRTAALVSSAGSIDWLCLPNFSDRSVFAKLLDPDGGCFSICPVQPFTVTRRYVPETAILETTFVTDTGSARLIDCIPVVDGIYPMGPMREILRVVEGIEGCVEFRAIVDPRPDYARLQPVPRQRGQLGWSYAWRNEILVVRSDFEINRAGKTLDARIRVMGGERQRISLSYTCGEPAVIPSVGSDADERLQKTHAWWRDWASQIVYSGRYRAEVVRSTLTVKLLSFTLSGAVIAAPTTSLPETVGEGRNWDYRYCWLRDAGLTVQAMIGVGIKDDAKAFLDWMLHATRLTWPKLQIMYDVYGRTQLDEYELPHLAGYRQSKPVRIGNGASTQQQIDVYGEVILAADTFVAAGGTIDPAGAKMLAGLGKVVAENWKQPDSGIWEKRGPQRHYTFSKMLCWAALDRLIALHERGAVELGDAAETYKAQRDEIAHVIESRAFNNELRAYTGELDGQTVDASVLLMPCIGYKSADHPRMRTTFELIDERLGENGLLQRYEPGTDDLRGKEGAFGICCFWAVDQLAKRGDYDLARERFEHLISFGNDLGLFAEEIHSKTGEALGNFPQAFTHVGLINAALSLEEAHRANARDRK